VNVLRICHGGRDRAHRGRERAIANAGVEITSVVPSSWPDPASEQTLTDEPFRIIELPAHRAGDLNRHRPRDDDALRRVIDEVRPDVLDLHEEPFSVAARHWLRVAPPTLPIVMYSAQNVDKRYPPPFHQYERAAYARVAGFYPCARQVASVLRAKGFAGDIEVLPLGYDDALFSAGHQTLDEGDLCMMVVGRLVPEKGIRDAVRVLAHLNQTRPAVLHIVGAGPERDPAAELAASLGIADRVRFVPWQGGKELASSYRDAHVVLVPSRPTTRWVEQFGRVIVEAQASGAVVAGYANGSIPEVAGEPGVLVATGDVEKLSRMVASVLHDHDDFEARRAGGLRLAATRTWAVVAARQIDLYFRVALGESRRVRMPRSPRRRRDVARLEFGPPASTLAGERPFALPVLRRGGPVARAMAAVADASAELAARLPADVPDTS
jgi:glycosyltransferase involved in cell wall biosynthesis